VTDEEYEAKVLSLIAEAVPPKLRKSKITPEMRLQHDLGLDSIGMLALMFRFEQEFKIDLATIDLGAALGQMQTVGEALAVGRDVLERAQAAAANE
jgi:acyl carrier protein